MPTKQIKSRVEADVLHWTPQVSERAAYEAWAGFLGAEQRLAPKQVLVMPHHGSANTPRFQLRSGVEAAYNLGRIVVQAPLAKPHQNAPANFARFSAHVLRDRFPADIEEQIEQAWDD